jgi:hypothetical protein
MLLFALILSVGSYIADSIVVFAAFWCHGLVTMPVPSLNLPILLPWRHLAWAFSRI